MVATRRTPNRVPAAVRRRGAGSESDSVLTLHLELPPGRAPSLRLRGRRIGVPAGPGRAAGQYRTARAGPGRSGPDTARLRLADSVGVVSMQSLVKYWTHGDLHPAWPVPWQPPGPGVWNHLQYSSPI